MIEQNELGVADVSVVSESEQQFYQNLNDVVIPEQTKEEKKALAVAACEAAKSVISFKTTRPLLVGDLDKIKEILVSGGCTKIEVILK